MPRTIRILSVGVLLGCAALVVGGLLIAATGSRSVAGRPAGPPPEPVAAVPDPLYSQQPFPAISHAMELPEQYGVSPFPTVVDGLSLAIDPTEEISTTIDDTPATEPPADEPIDNEDNGNEDNGNEDNGNEDNANEEADEEEGNEESEGNEEPEGNEESLEPYVPPAAEPLPRRELTEAQAALRDRVRRVLAYHRQRPLNAQQNTATEIMHACLPFGCATEVLRSATTSRTVRGTASQKLNGITCLCYNYPCGGFSPLVIVDGRIAARIGYGMQEKPSQLLATLALARVQADYPMRVGEHIRTVADLIEHEKLSCRAGDDLSMKLIGLSHYVDEPTWKNRLGEEWSIDRIIRAEIERPILTAADGGTARLLGLGYAVARRVRREQPVDGQYLRAQKFVADYHGYALQVQNADGSWGPRFMAAKGTSKDPVTQLRSTGHVLQWMVVTLPEQRLDDPQVARAISYVTRLLGSSRYRYGVKSYSTREIGAAMQALHALAVYDQRFYRPTDPEKPVEEVAKRPAG